MSKELMIISLLVVAMAFLGIVYAVSPMSSHSPMGAGPPYAGY